MTVHQTQNGVRTGWQPIKTAPKDSSLILAWDEFRGESEIIQSRNAEPPSFTHWMPLPPPPK